jgi:predicted ATP-grasp superfamily ATP-dependent carboligase
VAHSGVAVETEREARRDSGPSRPPVIILNLFYTGLGIARDLAGRGVRVIGLSAHRRIFGNYTRFCDVRFSPNSQEEPEQLLQYLLEAAPELQGSVIFPTRDADVLFMDRFRHELEPHYRLAIPPHDAFVRTVDKYSLVQVATQVGVPVPRTAVIARREDLADVNDDIGFPCVVKPVSSVQWRVGDNWSRVGGRKAFRVDSAEQLRQEYERLQAVSPELLIQEMIPGPADQIVVLGGYVDEKSEPLGYFTARKLLQSPDDFGTGCLVQSEPIPEIVDPTLKLWRALNYQGMAEVEYKYDPRDGHYKLIEINTRHWDQHQLGRASGINLTWAAYCHLTGRPAENMLKPVQRAQWVAEDTLLLHLLGAVIRPQQRTPHLWQKLSRPRMYGISAWNDPMPSCRYFVTVIFPQIVRGVFKKIRGES